MTGRRGFAGAADRSLQAGLLLVVLAAGCANSERPAASFDPGPLRQRALETIQRGILFKPAQQDAATLAYELAPLLIRRLGETVAPPVTRVYWSQDDVEIAARTHARWTYYWRDGSGLPQGVRMTMDSTGSPAIWEVLHAEAPRRIVYVSTGLEAVAAATHGAPGGAAFASESPGGFIVARAIEAGPMALGPFVYLSGAGGNEVRTILCRCMPSQVNDIPEAAEYELVEAARDERDPPDWGPAGPADGLRLDGLSF